MRSWSSIRFSLRSAQRAVVALYIATCLAVAVQRGVVNTRHSTFKIFRQSFPHLVAGKNLYALYPTEQGGAPDDLFKYSPTAALFFAPFSLTPYALALFAWLAAGALLLYWSLTLILEARQAVIAALLLYPDLVASLQASSSNAHVAALIILAYAAMERRHQLTASIAIVAGAAIKIFPLAALTFALFHPRRRRFALIVAATSVIAVILPLVITPPTVLAQQYRWWFALERSDATDLAFGLSAMRLARGWLGGSWPSWPLQIVGTVTVLLPVALRRDRWADAEFRLAMLASVLAFVVLFNHQAERSSFVIASAGVAVWCTTPPRETTLPWPRTLLAISALVGLRTIPLLAVWIVMQLELYGWRFRPWRSMVPSIDAPSISDDASLARQRIVS